MKLSIITGLSGSGKSVALHALEDAGYYCIDNLPAFLLPSLATELANRQDDCFQLTAVGIDARNPTDALGQLSVLMAPLKKQGIHYEVIFLEAQDETLIKRFSETRRKHPLSNDNRSLAEAISYERELLASFLSAADLKIDTTQTNVHQLRRLIQDRMSDHGETELSLLVQSFGFKHNVPRDADFVFDVRCLPNPHWHPELRPLTGRDNAVISFLEKSSDAQEMKKNIKDYLMRWIPNFADDGRSYLTIAIGCTGGQHRSVYLAEQLAADFQATGQHVQVRHREISD